MAENSGSTEQRIRDIAHALWEKEGRPDGRAEEFWYRARSQVESEDGADEAPLAPAETATEHDRQLEQTFPASDPPSHGVIVGPSS